MGSCTTHLIVENFYVVLAVTVKPAGGAIFAKFQKKVTNTCEITYFQIYGVVFF